MAELLGYSWILTLILLRYGENFVEIDDWLGNLLKENSIKKIDAADNSNV